MNRRETRRWIKKQNKDSERAAEKLKDMAIDKVMVIYERLDPVRRATVRDRIQKHFEENEG